ncbi:hypothetical protein CVT24_008783 [Panaeolus cyanescens]|uniref:Uncharacterized protein n=1 Tax=Panaeolus cyanescens TaxID=181874 RepID=A0A409YX55_9AGAR|nr:hypothetical protein CVT24_008783 [Panaeolus cyanescens]
MEDAQLNFPMGKPICPSSSFNFSTLLQEAFHCENMGISVDDDADPIGLEQETQPTPSNEEALPCTPSTTPPHLPDHPTSSSSLNNPHCTPTTGALTNREAKSKQSRSNGRRANKRRKKTAEKGHEASEYAVFEHVQLSDPLVLPIDHAQLPVSTSGYVGVRSREPKRTLQNTHTLDQLLALGFEVVKWDGHEARPITDSAGRICGVLAGRPRGNSFDKALERTCDLLHEESARAPYQPGVSKHRRGEFTAIGFGISFGGGQTKAQRLATGHHHALVEQFLASHDISRIASFADSAFATWSPRLYEYYRTTLHKASAHTGQPINFPGSCFAAMSVNMGGHVCCFKHRDCVNLAFGWCAITSLGDFDPTKGGHFVLWDLKLIIEFPPGSTILIPSAVFSHSNTEIAPHESRFSITQYTAGALFRWVENGFRTDEELKKLDPEHYSHMSSLKSSRFEHGINMYSTLEELCSKV